MRQQTMKLSARILYKAGSVASHMSTSDCLLLSGVGALLVLEAPSRDDVGSAEDAADVPDVSVAAVSSAQDVALPSANSFSSRLSWTTASKSPSVNNLARVFRRWRFLVAFLNSAEMRFRSKRI